MPEGPEVHTIAKWLQSEVVGLILLNLNYNQQSRYGKLRPLPLIEELRTWLPSIIIDVDAKGKKIIFMLESEDGSNIFLISSLAMEGKWIWDDQKHCDLWLDLLTPEGEERRLYFKDSRHFGTLEILFGSEELMTRLREIGPDLLVDEISDREWLHKLRNGRIKRKKIGLFLMEQKYFSGIGNYLRAEILYAARISPHRSLESLSDDEALLVFNEARRIIWESYAGQGASLRTYQSPYGGKGTFQVVIYDKRVDPLGNPVIVENIGDNRTTHWVPALQV